MDIPAPKVIGTTMQVMGTAMQVIETIAQEIQLIGLQGSKLKIWVDLKRYHNIWVDLEDIIIITNYNTLGFDFLCLDLIRISKSKFVQDFFMIYSLGCLFRIKSF